MTEHESVCGYRHCTRPLAGYGIPWCRGHHEELRMRLRPRECLVCWNPLSDMFALFCSPECQDRWPTMCEGMGLPPTPVLVKGRRRR